MYRHDPAKLDQAVAAGEITSGWAAEGYHELDVRSRSRSRSVNPADDPGRAGRVPVGYDALP